MPINKVELHVHLEGTISPELAKKLAHRNKLSIPNGLVAPNGKSYLSRDFLHFLSVYDTVAELIRTPLDFYDITFDYLRSCALENTIYVEMMYSPHHAEMMSKIPSIEHLHAIQQAIDDAKAQFGIVGRILITIARQFGVEIANNIAKQIDKANVPCATGFAMGGDEMNYPPKLFSRAYHMAADAGLSCTVHAGEFMPASGMLEAIQHLPIKRIGHGIQAIHSPETINLLIERDIALELCPTSNIVFGLIPSMAEHPFPKFLDAGVKVSLNSDDPPFVDTTIGQEYERVQEAYQYSDDTMNSISKMAIHSAFIDDTTKQALLAQFSK